MVISNLGDYITVENNRNHVAKVMRENILDTHVHVREAGEDAA
jgi:hypothetical protein